MTFRYIGSKARLADKLAKHIGLRSTEGSGRFIDAFCGTGVVGEAAARLGWPIWINDHLHSACIVAAARLISAPETQFKQLGGYKQAVKTLNDLNPTEGFIWREYSPASANHVGIERRYFSKHNAGRIDSIRSQISKWKDSGVLNDLEETLLIADLLSASNRVANIAGTYGCFLSRWTKQSEGKIILRSRELSATQNNVTVTIGDVSNLQVNPNDLVYLDPPYTKRQYASYYHIPETIALGDKPSVEGVSGLRPWHSKASDYCYKRKALQSITDLIRRLNSRRILLSYSAEGHVPIDKLSNSLSELGSITICPLKDVGRYRSNMVSSSAGSSVCEYLIIINKREAIVA